MYEIEVKAYCPDTETFIHRLSNMGGVKKAELAQTDIYFNHPQRDFRQTDEAFRIRTVNGHSSLTYKGPKLSSEAKTRMEYETTVGDFDTIRHIIQALGFVAGGVVKKTRLEYSLHEVTVCVDSVAGLGNFVEFEKIAVDIPATEKMLFDLAHQCGLDNFEKRSYLDLLMEQSP